MFDWLKALIKDKEPDELPKQPPKGKNRIWIDRNVYPIVAVDRYGFVAEHYDGRVVENQKVRLALHIDDLYGTFSFNTMVTITKTTTDRFAGTWFMLLPDYERVLIKYKKNVLAAQAKRK